MGGDIAMDMGVIFGSILLGLVLLAQGLKLKDEKVGGNWFPTTDNSAKRDFEIYALKYSVVWCGVFGVVIAMKLYEQFTEVHYMALCTTLALPFLLQPILFPFEAEKNLPLTQRYSFKANVWIAIFSFVGNFWYTHYFYNVLKASYTMPSHRLNDVPIALFFATHFYFMLYHTASNLFLRKLETRYEAGTARSVFFWSVVFAFSYFTAFMETLSISSFPDYSFEDRYMAYTVGSLFYGIYFIVSYPVFYRLDEKVGGRSKQMPHTFYQTVMEAFGTSMIVLCLLDFGRLWLEIPLTIPGKLYYVYQKGM